MKSYLCGLVVLALATVAFGIPLQSQDAKAVEDDEYRLPETVWPWNYRITIRPYLRAEDGNKQFTFDGEVYIRLNTSETNLKTIVLHSKKLNYTKSELYPTLTPANTIAITNTTNTVTDKVTFTLATPLTAGVNYTLHFVYTGLMEDDMHGFYKSYYIDDKNNTRWLGSTQFQTNHARRAFPCFDEPKFKATFDVIIRQHNSFSTVSNTRVASTEIIDNEHTAIIFRTTPIMSTYLLAFLVSDFKERTNGAFSVTAREEFYDQTEYGLTVGEKLLKEFDSYTNLPYYTLGVDKMHLAAIPDFSAGAMENWGLLTFRERSLLYDSVSSALSAKQAIAAVISHEQAHMWFGDLVTCNWWSYTWLNEGFARYFQYFMTHVVEPSFQLDQQFIVDQVQAIMLKDSTNDTNPMTDLSVSTPADLSRMFNQISYNKGASVIRMIRHAMGEDNFKASLQSYLKDKSYKSPEPKELLAYWKQKWPADTVKYADAVFSSFTEQVGYPVIYLDIASDFSSMKVSQKRFLLDPTDGSKADLLYTIPFTYTSSAESNFANTAPKMYLTNVKEPVTVALPANTTWVIGNIQQTGYYRLNYTVEGWRRIHHALMTAKWGGIHEINRAQYVDDLLNLARGSVIEYDLALECLGYIEGETNYLPWTSAFNGLNFLSIRLGEDTENFGNYITELSKKVYSDLGFTERSTDTTMDKYLRSKLISWLCRYGHEECNKKSLELFRAMKTKPIPVNIRGSVYCSALRAGNEADFKALYAKFQAERVPTEQTLIINNLGCIRDEKLVKEYFDIIVSDEIRPQDKSTALSSLYTNNNENVSPVFNLVTSNVDALAKTMGYSSVASVISNIASRFTTEAQQKQLEDFIKKDGEKFESSVKTLNEALKTVKLNLAWSSKKLGSIKTFLEGYKTGGANAVGVSILTVLMVTVVSIILH